MSDSGTAGLIARARAAVSIEEVIDVTQKLVRIPTENPPGDTRAACDVIAAELRPVGFEIEYYEPVDGFVSVIATFPFPDPGRTLILNGHLDVVPVGGSANQWRYDPWGAWIEEGRLYGRGSLDMKGPLSALLVAARTVVAHIPLRGKLIFTAVADEEAGGRRGTGALVEAGKLVADGALIVEPSAGGVTIAHRGQCWIRLTTRGVSAHAAEPSNGVNAVQEMVDVLKACRDLKLRHEPHVLLGSPTIAVGTTISGGEKINVVPDLCHATLDCRHVPGMTEQDVVDDLRSHLEKRRVPQHAELDIDVFAWGEAATTSADASIVQAACAAHQREFAEPPTLRGERGATDGWWLANRAAIPTVIAFGPGGIADVHIVDECVEVKALERYSRVYAETIVRFLAEPTQ